MVGEERGDDAPEGMFDAGAFPDFKIAHDLDQYASDGTSSIEEEQAREGRHCKGATGTPLHMGSDEKVAETPEQAGSLVGSDALLDFAPGRGR